MQQMIIKNIRFLMQIDESGRRRVCGEEMKQVSSLEDAYLVIRDGKIAAYGKMDDYRFDETEYQIIDATGRFVFPAFCDSHTHIVYAASRESEFVDKINGLSYVEIAERGGGILNSAKRLHDTPEEELYQQAMCRVRECMGFGTGALEIKSGYGLSLEDELKMLRVIRRIKEEAGIAVRSTFLAAHAIPAEYKANPDGYVDLIVKEMIPIVGKEDLADYIDVFCDEGFFTVPQTERILEEGAKYGLIPKIHANELALSGGIQVGVRHGALSVDHLEHTGDAEIEELLQSETMPALLPGAAFFLGMNYPPARKMIDAGLSVALASDYNPGSSPSGNMKFVMSLAAIKMKMLPEEILNAVTLNGAYAMGLEKEYGSITVGKKASVVITKPMPSFAYFMYAYTSDLVEHVLF